MSSQRFAPEFKLEAVRLVKERGVAVRPDDTEVARPRARDLLGFPEGAGMAACRGNQAGRNGNPRRTSQTTLTKYHAPKPASTKRTDLNLSVPRKR